MIGDDSMEFGERFTYQNGDIQLRPSQCKFCKNNAATKLENGRPTCVYYPDGKSMDILINKVECPYFEKVSKDS